MRQIEILASTDLDFKNIEDYLVTEWSLDVLLDFYENMKKHWRLLLLKRLSFLAMKTRVLENIF